MGFNLPKLKWLLLSASLVFASNGAALTHWQINTRHLDGQSKATTSGGAGTITTAKALDGLGRIDTLKTGSASNATLIQNANYDIDSFGNLVARSDLPNGLTITSAETYLYDALNRVTGKNGVANSVATYDALGKSITDSAAPVPPANASNAPSTTHT